VATLYAQPGWFDAFSAAVHFATPKQVAWLYALRRALLWGYAAVLVATLAARWLRGKIQRRRAAGITYPDGRMVEITRGASILEASRQAGILCLRRPRPLLDLSGPYLGGARAPTPR
jgi:adenylate cyclase